MAEGKRKMLSLDDIEDELNELYISDEEDNLLLESIYDSDEGEVYMPVESEIDSEEYSDDEEPSTSHRMSTHKRHRTDVNLFIGFPTEALPASATPPPAPASPPPAPASPPPAPASPPPAPATPPPVPAAQPAPAYVRPVIATTVIALQKNRLYGCSDSHIWKKNPSDQRTRSIDRPQRHVAKSCPIGIAKEADTAEKCFSLFLNANMIADIVTHTNTAIDTFKAGYSVFTKSTFAETNVDEVRALIGILLFSGCQRSNHLRTEKLFNKSTGSPIFIATMSERRFVFLIRCLRFDDVATRLERRADDRFAPIRQLWDEFIVNCQTNYSPGPAVTVDEQLLAFRGRCPFRIYIPSKPAKYGIKILMVCDVKSKYMLNAIPYLGKNANLPDDATLLGQGHYYTRELVRTYAGSGRTVTTDNWFTSLPLALDLLNNFRLLSIGTLRLNKPYIPNEMKVKTNRVQGTVMYCYDKDIMMASYMPQKKTVKKIVPMLSTVHQKPENSNCGKPKIIADYNKTKGGVDAFDQMCGTYSCSRRTRRWPLCIFYGMINAIGIQAWIIFSQNKRQMARTDFM